MKGKQELPSCEEAEVYLRKYKKHDSRYTGKIKFSVFKESKIV